MLSGMRGDSVAGSFEDGHTWIHGMPYCCLHHGHGYADTQHLKQSAYRTNLKGVSSNETSLGTIRTPVPRPTFDARIPATLQRALDRCICCNQTGHFIAESRSRKIEKHVRPLFSVEGWSLTLHRKSKAVEVKLDHARDRP